MSGPNGRRPLPEGWRLLRLGDVGQISAGITLGNRVFNVPTRQIPYLRVANVKDGYLDLSDVYEIEATEAEIEKCRLRYGDLLLTEGGDPDKLGRGSFWENQIPKCIHQNHIFRVRFDLGEFSPEFVSAQIGSPYGKAYFLAHAKQTTGIATINQKVLANLPLMVPPLPEQKRIAAILAEQMAAIERARAAAEAQLEAAKELPAAYLRAVFESEEAREWERKRLGEVASVSGGIQKSPDRAPKNFHRPYLTVRNVQRGWLDLSQVERFEVTPDEFSRLRLEYGDILIVEGNGSIDHIGRTAIFRGEIEECIHQNHLIRIRLDKSAYDPEFLSHYLNSHAGKVQITHKARTTSGLYTLSVSKVEDLVVPIPPLEKQKSIVVSLKEQMAACEQVHRGLEGQLEAIGRLPGAVLRQAFSGELTRHRASTLPIFLPKHISDSPTTIRDWQGIVGSYIIASTDPSKPYGRVQLEKALYLTETYVGINLGGHYIRGPFGPYDSESLRALEEIAAKEGWFTRHLRAVERRAFYYQPGSNIQNQVSKAQELLGDRCYALDHMLSLLKDRTTRQVEIVTTLYAAWNDFLLDGQQPTDEQIIHEVLYNWHPSKKKRLTPGRLQWGLAWMRTHRLVPRGIGSRTQMVTERQDEEEMER